MGDRRLRRRRQHPGPDVVLGALGACAGCGRHARAGRPDQRVEFWTHALDPCAKHVEHVHAGALVLGDRGSFRVACDQLSVDTRARAPVRVIPCGLHGRHSRSLTTMRDPRVVTHADVGGFSAQRGEIELALWALNDPLMLHHLWCCLILAHVSHALHMECAGHAGMDVCEVSLDRLIRLTPGWLSRGRTPLEDAVRVGRDLGLRRPSTRHRLAVPWIDPRWVVPPPPRRCTLRRWAALVLTRKGPGRRALASSGFTLAHSLRWSRCSGQYANVALCAYTEKKRQAG